MLPVMDPTRINISKFPPDIIKLSQNISKFPPDIIFKFKDDEVSAHRMILAMVSEVFHNRFFTHKSVNEVVMEDTSKAPFQFMVDAIYNVKPMKESLLGKTFEDVIAVLDLVKKFKIPQLVLAVEDVLSSFSMKQGASTTQNVKRLRINTAETEVGPTNKEQARVMEKLKYILNFLENTQIKNEESIGILKKPLDDLLSSLKYLPTEPSLNILPTEMKTRILSYLCDNGAVVAASVCQEWRNILRKRLKLLKEVSIGKHCSNEYSCEDKKCLMPEEVLKASIVLKLDIPLSIHHPNKDVNSKLLAKGLITASRISIKGRCYDENYEVGSTLTNNQIEDLFEGLEEKNATMSSMKLEDINMSHLNQGKLANCLIKTKKLRLRESPSLRMLDIPVFIEKLFEGSTDSRLTHLDLSYLEIPSSLSKPFANALCKIKWVRLGSLFPRNSAVTKQLIANVLNEKIDMECFFMVNGCNWGPFISPEDLKTLINKMKYLSLIGTFTSEQIEAVRSLPGVKMEDYKIAINTLGLKISKGPSRF